MGCISKRTGKCIHLCATGFTVTLFACLKALVPRMSKLAVTGITTCLEPRTARSAAAALTGFSDGATFVACGGSACACGRERACARIFRSERLRVCVRARDRGSELVEGGVRDHRLEPVREHREDTRFGVRHVVTQPLVRHAWVVLWTRAHSKEKRLFVELCTVAARFCAVAAARRKR